MGIGTASIYTEDDSRSPHVEAAEVSAEVSDYLDIAAVIRAAKDTHSDAIHPGYGFLSENPAFARACADAGITFIGPSADSMEALGDKSIARETAKKYGIPVAEGFGPFSDITEIEKAAKELGTPLMLKAAAGGGGKGMKKLLSFDNLRSEIETSQRETKAAFGDDRLIVERYVHPARHIEVQIMADGERAIALGERECSLQRRHQKIIEESPSTAVDSGLREKLFEAATRIAEGVGYTNAGTVEFLVGSDGGYYFLEVNTRLQVEHPVTELCTGLDLVRMQIEIAGGLPMMSQDKVVRHGHAIEARLNAEDPYRGFLPSAGPILLKSFVDGIRVDTGLGDSVGTKYDSLIAKIVSHGDTREEAIERLIFALRESAILGIYTNQTFLLQILESDFFKCGETYTSTIDSLEIGLRPVPPELEISAAAAFRGPVRNPADVWSGLGAWRMK
jgi:acetyl/propionyl-CoA carboxylase alpha subunit